LAAPTRNDRHAFLEAMRASRSLHHPWVNPPVDDSGFEHFLSSASQDGEEVYLVRTNEGDQICGVVGLNLIVYRALCSASLSYYGVQGFQQKGLMREALNLLIRHAFDELSLNRLEANIQPGNVRSIELVRSLGFRREGYSPRFLIIGGKWRDHERWAILHDEF
jgi:ribosomal-protein-alanine N-acetyltransferase